MHYLKVAKIETANGPVLRNRCSFSKEAQNLKFYRRLSSCFRTGDFSKESKITKRRTVIFLRNNKLASRTDIVSKEVLLLTVTPKNRCSNTVTISKEQLIYP